MVRPVFHSRGGGGEKVDRPPSRGGGGLVSLYVFARDVGHDRCSWSLRLFVLFVSIDLFKRYSARRQFWKSVAPMAKLEPDRIKI